VSVTVTEGEIELMGRGERPSGGGVAHGEGKVAWRCPSYRRGDRREAARPPAAAGHLEGALPS
jgi:hypothetical protein